MTDREKAIVMAYTGIVMLKGDKFKVFHGYVEELFGREVYTHEFLSLHDEIKERSKADFLKLCGESEKIGKWEWVQYVGLSNIGNWHCSECRHIVIDGAYKHSEMPKYEYCPNCGVRMKESEVPDADSD